MLNPQMVLFLCATLFCVGLYGVLSRNNLILMLMSLELMLNSANIALVAFSRYWAGQGLDAGSFSGAHSGQFFALMVMAVAAAEVGVGLAIIVALFRKRHNSDVRAASELKH
ncbi:NADH-quinone oxidoreductase subunit NuoK [bacterium]|nr:MAG: NADH-quinone oxidoreductase subunit NuoK [bacterium]RIK63416.1 MAG: NADH-quinone oxidoreductase subunit NuoK [Planctomycetota bacterium]